MTARLDISAQQITAICKGAAPSLFCIPLLTGLYNYSTLQILKRENTEMTKSVAALNNILNSQDVFHVAINNVEMPESKLRAIIRRIYETARVALIEDKNSEST